ncbi:dystrophin-like isoform X1, partial [Paramuricea clavata]
MHTRLKEFIIKVLSHKFLQIIIHRYEDLIAPVDVFTLDGVPSVGEVEKLRIWHDNTGLDPSWKLRSVSVQDRSTGEVYLFNCYSLLSKDEGSTLDDIKCTGKAEPR